MGIPPRVQLFLLLQLVSIGPLNGAVIPADETVTHQTCTSCCSSGSSSLSGMPGNNGIPGNNGSPGSPGPSGQAGLPGQSGSIGPSGLKGERGEPGIGLPGPEGPVGVRGLQGLPGKLGPSGVSGAVGARGNPGEAGMKGDQGDDGMTYMPRRSAFTVTRSTSRTASQGNEIIPFQNIVLNEGNNFDIDTSKFTAAASGIYLFSFTSMCSSPKSSCGYKRLVKNGDVIVSAYGHDTYAMGANTALMHLIVGDQVWITFRYSGELVYSESADPFTSFSGVLLYEDY